MNQDFARRFAPTVVALATLFALQAHAADREDDDEHSGGYSWALGAGAAVHKSPYTGVGTKTDALPLVMFDDKYVRLFANQFDIKLPSVGPLTFALRTQISIGEGYKSSDSPELAGMATRKGSIFVGGTSTWHNDIANLSLTWLKDVSGNSKGSEIKIGAEHSFYFERRFEVTPHLEYLHDDSKFVDYYYGVRANEATATRPEYLGKATSEVQAGVRLGYLLLPHQRLLLDVSDNHLGSGITKSPIVDRKSTPVVKIGYMYVF